MRCKANCAFSVPSKWPYHWKVFVFFITVWNSCAFDPSALCEQSSCVVDFNIQNQQKKFYNKGEDSINMFQNAGNYLTLHVSKHLTSKEKEFARSRFCVNIKTGYVLSYVTKWTKIVYTVQVLDDEYIYMYLKT